MAFTTEMATLVADQLSRFLTLNRHQLAGQAANLDFWIEEVRHALGVIDGCRKRFHRLKVAQARYVRKHATIEFALDDPRGMPLAPDPPHRIRDEELREARRSLADAAYRFLVRCLNDGLISEARIRAKCDALGISIDSTDVRSRAR
jgi:hypothetical protein